MRAQRSKRRRDFFCRKVLASVLPNQRHLFVHKKLTIADAYDTGIQKRHVRYFRPVLRARRKRCTANKL